VVAVSLSSREAYVSPTRGAQGNALKTIVAMPFVLDGERGQVDIHAHGVKHTITMSVDRIRQVPVINHQREPSDVKIGTTITIPWSSSPRSNLDDAKARFLQIIAGYAWLNPHASIGVEWFGERTTHDATNPDWTKWKPSDPTSPHWYDQHRLTRLIAGYIAHDADTGRTTPRTVREFVAEFRGLSSTAKQKAILDALELTRAPLTALVVDGNAIDGEKVGKLLAAMKANSKPVKPAALGLIGEEHFREKFERIVGFEKESFEYRKVLDLDEHGVPSVAEVAFGWMPNHTRRMVTGVNWSPGIQNPFRQLGAYGTSLDTVLTNQRCNSAQPITIVLHLACPRVDYTDAGKSAISVRA
jgi:hypothetical protein